MPIGTDPTELAFMLQDLGVSVVYGAQSTLGILTNTETPVFDVDSGLTQMVRRTDLLIPDGALTKLTQDATITVAGTAYLIRNIGSSRPDGLKPLEVVPA